MRVYIEQIYNAFRLAPKILRIWPPRKARWLSYLVIAGLVLFASEARFSPKEPVPEPVQGFFSWAETINSFRAGSLVLDTQNRPIGTTTFYWQSPEVWEMIMAEGDSVAAQWKFVDDSLYVRDFSDDSWWVDTSSRPVITSSVDFRSWIERAQQRSDSIRFVWQRSEPCGETQCWVYIVRDPAYETGRETIRHRLWLEHDTYALVKEEYGGDTGTTITEFTELNQINVEPPLVTKPLPDETSPYLASGSVVVSGPAYFPFTVLE